MKGQRRGALELIQRLPGGVGWCSGEDGGLKKREVEFLSCTRRRKKEEKRRPGTEDEVLVQS